MVFRSHEHQITFIEKSDEVCNALEAKYSVPIYHGDGSRLEILQQVGVDNVDVAIAATNSDDQNIVAAMQAKRLGMRLVMAIVTQHDYRDLIQDEGIVAISAPWATAALVENYLDRPGVAELFEIGEGVAHLVGVYVPKEAKVVDQAIRDIPIPGECVVAAVVRGKKFVVPRGPTVIEPDDHVIFVGPASAIKDAQDLFLERA